jgi:hypothetical protein
MERTQRQLSVRRKQVELEWHPLMDISRKDDTKRRLPPTTLFSAKRVVIKRETAVRGSKKRVRVPTAL